MSPCILCRSEVATDDFAEEHVFPQAIGGSLVLKNALCKACNSYLGHHVDSELVNNPLIQMARLSLGIKGKSGIPNPFFIGHLADNKSHKVQYRFDERGRPERLYSLPYVKTERNEEGILATLRLDECDRDKIPDILAKLAERNGFTLMEEQVAKMMSAPVKAAEHPKVTFKMSFHRSSWKMALVKIAYELAYYWLGALYLVDPAAERLRSILASGQYLDDVHDFNGCVNFTGRKLAIPFWCAEEGLHVAFLTQIGNQLICYIRIFQSIEAVIPISALAYGITPFDSPVILLDAQSMMYRELNMLAASQEIVRAARSARSIHV